MLIKRVVSGVVFCAATVIGATCLWISFHKVPGSVDEKSDVATVTIPAQTQTGPIAANNPAVDPPYRRLDGNRIVVPALRLSPTAILASAKPADPVLAAWVANWLENWKRGNDLTPSQLDELRAILDRTPLASLDLLDLAHAIHFTSQEVELSAIVYDAASVRVDRELDQKSSPASRIAIVSALYAHLDDYKHTLWPMIEEHHQTKYAETLFRLYSAFVHFAPMDDPRMAAAIRHPAIGAAECLYKLGRSEEALKSLEEMSPSIMTTGEKESFSWIYAITLIDAERWSDAVPYLQTMIADPKFTFPGEAQRLLTIALAKSGNADQAHEEYLAFVRTNPGDISRAIELATEVEEARAISTHRPHQH